MRIEEGANKVSEYEYDGTKRRTVKKTYVSGQLDQTRHYFYTEPSRWHVLEERVGSSTSVDRHFVRGSRYVDDLIVRDRDTNSNGTLDERLYAMQDANWNVTSIAATSSTVQERYAYQAYGTPIVFTAAFLVRGSSDFAWETTFGAYRWDGEVMLFQVRNRVYAATIGGWLQRDPLGFVAGPSLYTYGASKPVSTTDPSGQIAPVVCGSCTCDVPCFRGLFDITMKVWACWLVVALGPSCTLAAFIDQAQIACDACCGVQQTWWAPSSVILKECFKITTDILVFHDIDCLVLGVS